ncbi:GHKL domain-containing protein [Blautia faecis]|uniref:sensor histidine kinase n=1 Tax=Blautia faecis TaxID=871665 RepID=UPI001570BC1A|nr:sensor histidine kinase [Blautia faecis]NSG92029.1 GHKL domain-containing protein [Blautia faecis]
MSMSKTLSYGTDILFIIFAVYLFFYYFDIFLKRRKRTVLSMIGLVIFMAWQFEMSSVNLLPAYGNIIVTIITTLFAVAQIYEGKFWNKCIFTIAFNAIWMLIETISGNIFLTYCCEFTDLQALGTLGSFTSKIVFMIAITALKRVFTKDEIKELPVRYSFMLVLIPIGSIYIMNNIFMLGYKLHSNRANIQSAVTAVILLGVNVLVFYIYIKLADDLQLRRMTSVYEQQLDLCERHQQERELSILRLRDMRHNMKNNLVSILAYAENGDNEKIIRFVNEIMEEGGIKTSTVTNSGNIVIDSLIGYWYVEAKKVGIDFSVNLNIPMEMPFRGADICLILGNLLENAVEAAQKAEGKKYIRLHMKYDKNNLLLFVENNYKGVLIKTKDKRLKSTKTDAENHGVGLSSVYRIAAKYHGVVTIDDDVANRFLIRVVLYGKQE